MLVGLLHIFVVAPLLIYIGVQRASTPEFLYNGLILIGFALFIYHTYTGYTKWAAGSSNLLIHVVHSLVIAPVLVAIGYYKKETTQQLYDSILLLAFGAIGYHAYYLIMQAHTVSGAL